MTRTQFFKEKANIAKRLNHFLAMSKHVGYPVHTSCIDKVYGHFTVPEGKLSDYDRARLIESLQSDSQIEFEGITKATGRHDYFDRLRVVEVAHEVKDSIPQQAIDKEMKSFVRRAMKLDRWTDLDCKVMQLFKDGVIEWDEVVKAHNGDCQI